MGYIYYYISVQDKGDIWDIYYYISVQDKGDTWDISITTYLYRIKVIYGISTYYISVQDKGDILNINITTYSICMA